MASENQLPYRQVNICASLEMTTKWIPARKPPMPPSLTMNYYLFMQNKANFRRAQINVNSFLTKDYRKNDAFAVQKNKANSKPIGEDQYKTKDPRHKTKDTSLESEVWDLKSGRKAKMDVNNYSTKDYENKARDMIPYMTIRESPTHTGPDPLKTGKKGSNFSANLLC